MSGIAAALGPVDNHSFQQMLERIRHRGPEGEHIYTRGSVQLGEVGFKRGQLKDIEYKGYALVLDGEPLLGYEKLSREELLDIYLERGPRFVKELNGKFALVISNGDDFFAARDLFGIKPLYYAGNGKNIYFASELKSLLRTGHAVNIFPPGHFFNRTEGFVRFKEMPSVIPQDNLKLEEAERKLKTLVLAAVERALDSRENSGIFLSGGADSSIIAAAAGQVSGRGIPAFVAGLEGSPDVESSARAAQYLGMEHFPYIYSIEEIFEVLPEVIYYLESFDVELINSSIANYFVSRLAQAHDIRVILSGEGADELFGGYHFLKQCRDDEELNYEIKKLLMGLHNGAFQRVDRMAMAHSLEVEMPFLDPAVVDFALKLPSHWKISEDDTGKWLLRKAFTADVPTEIIWRRKAQFGIGTGTENVMHKYIEEKVSDEEFHNAGNEGELDFKSKEEYYYYSIFKRFYPHKSALKTVNRWLV